MNTFEVYFYWQRKPTPVKANIFDMSDKWVTFYDNSIPSDIKIVAIFAASDIMYVLRKDE